MENITKYDIFPYKYQLIIVHCRFLTSTEAQLPGNATSSGDKNNENPNVGVIVAIVISIAIVIIAIIVGGFMCVRRKKKKEKENENSLSFKNISEVEISGIYQIIYSL